VLLTFFEDDEQVEKMEIFCIGSTHLNAFNVEKGGYHILHGILDVEYKGAPGVKWIFSLMPEEKGKISDTEKHEEKKSCKSETKKRKE
jgi:hypothetical protein